MSLAERLRVFERSPATEGTPRRYPGLRAAVRAGGGAGRGYWKPDRGLLRYPGAGEHCRVRRQLFLGFLPYKMWGSFFRRGENMEPNVNSGKKLVVYFAVTILASVVCAV